MKWLARHGQMGAMAGTVDPQQPPRLGVLEAPGGAEPLARLIAFEAAPGDFQVEPLDDLASLLHRMHRGDLAAPRVRTTYHTVTVHRAGVTPSPRTVVLTGSGRSSPLAGEGSGSESEFESDEGSDESHGESEASDD